MVDVSLTVAKGVAVPMLAKASTKRAASMPEKLCKSCMVDIRVGKACPGSKWEHGADLYLSTHKSVEC